MQDNRPSPAKQVLLHLSPLDNVLITLATIPAGPTLAPDNGEIDIERPLTLGHKVAAVNIAAGEKIIKYGVSIGSATKAIRRGAHVHVHNMKSDYTPTHTLAETESGEST